MISINEFEAGLKNLADRIKIDFSSTITANPEDQLKRPLSDFLESLIPNQITSRTEAQVEGLGARPDIGVARNHLLCGHIELKAPGISIKRLTGSNKTQFEKFKALPNLIYTNSTDWIHYKSGVREGPIISFSGELSEDGSRAVTKEGAEKLYKLFTDFLTWEPIVPKNPKALAEMLAPLCRLLRSDVEIAVIKEDSSIEFLYRDWKRLLFPDADINQFADAYAQTLTYALLLARLSGATNITTSQAASCLDADHSLLAQTLRLLGQNEAYEEMKTSVSILQRVIGAVDPAKISKKGDPWLYFYEDFLSIYDPKLRKDYGVYYTPVEVVECQVNLCSDLLRNIFEKHLGFADEKVTFLDPAVGTGTYPLTAIQNGINMASDLLGHGAIPSIATRMAENFHAFEIMVGPYAVSHMRIAQILKNYGSEFPDNGIKIFLTDTLDDPEADIPRFSFAEKEIAEEHMRAQDVKRNTEILVCMGNPPYDREQREINDEYAGRKKGGWIRFGANTTNYTDTTGILKDFVEGAPGIHVKNLYNDYVYFWRWALWKLFENETSSQQGIISFITASSYLRGPGFVSMRRRMREAFDKLWIIDLEGDNLGARKTENVFNIQTPVAIAIGIKTSESNSDTPAEAWYTKIIGTRDDKLAALKDFKDFNHVNWQACFEEWEKPFLPQNAGDYFSYPLITDIFPWQHSGSQYKRKWPIASQAVILNQRWQILVSEDDLEKRKILFKESRDRKITKDYRGSTKKLPGGMRIALLDSDTPIPTITRYAFRSFDRQYCISDNRLGDFLRPELWDTYSDNQVFMVSYLSEVLGIGPAAIATSYIPDLHYFRGSFGGKHVIPLWKDVNTRVPNITEGILSQISEVLGSDINPPLLFAYCYGVLCNPTFTEYFSEELIIPGPRIPITKDVGLFNEVCNIGSRLLFLHTYGERFIGPADHRGRIPQGSARCIKSVPLSSEAYPEEFSYDENSKTLLVGKGEFHPVSSEVFNFSISNWEVVKKWLSYRMKSGAGRKSSPLDEIRPQSWTAEFTKELLELLWVLEETIDLFNELNRLFQLVISSNCFNEDELAKPTSAEKHALQSQGQLL